MFGKLVGAPFFLCIICLRASESIHGLPRTRCPPLFIRFSGQRSKLQFLGGAPPTTKPSPDWNVRERQLSLEWMPFLGENYMPLDGTRRRKAFRAVGMRRGTSRRKASWLDCEGEALRVRVRVRVSLLGGEGMMSRLFYIPDGKILLMFSSDI